VHQLLVTANVVPSSLILFALVMEILCSSETPVLTRVTQHNIPEDGDICLAFTQNAIYSGNANTVNSLLLTIKI
jgi:hypothetical protein